MPSFTFINMKHIYFLLGFNIPKSKDSTKPCVSFLFINIQLYLKYIEKRGTKSVEINKKIFLNSKQNNIY